MTFIDTADSYGPDVSESLIADALYPYPDELVIATKAGLERPGPNHWTVNGRPDHIRKACDGSLSRLRLEQIPLYQQHRPDPDVPYAESIGAMVELQREGKIRHIGVSNVDVDELREAQSLATIVSVQNRFNLGDRESEAVLEAVTADGLAFLPWAPIQQADEHGAIAEIASNARGGHPTGGAGLAPGPLAVDAADPGTGSPSHLEHNVAAAAIELSPDEIEILNEAAA